MSIKQELIELKEAREDLREKLKNVTSTLTTLSNSQSLLQQKVESFKTRTSPLAKSLLEKTQKELDTLNQEVSSVKEQKKQLEKALAENQKNISEREDDTLLYIQEQSNMIVSSFLKYLRNHSEEIGLEIKKVYSFLPITRREWYRGDLCDVPTGNLGIYDDNTKSFIVSSTDFYFTQSLYTLLFNNEYECSECHFSKWFMKYHKRFVSVFLETLAERYDYEECFKLTIDGNNFTLELV